MRRTTPCRAAAAGLLALTGAAAPAWAEPAKTERVSVSTAGEQGDWHSFNPAISADGRFVAFTSQSTNLVKGDTNQHDDIFVRDLLRHTTERVSIATGGGQSNGDSDLATISGDGRYFAFASEATNLVKGDTSKNVDIFVRDRLKGTTERVDLTWNGAQIGKGSAGWGMISNDGRYVSFGSAGATVVKGVTHGADLFVRDRVKGTTELASLNGSIALPRGISGQGRYVSFESYDARHVKGDTNRNKDVFVYDRTTRKTVRASVSSTGQQGNRDSYGGALSPDGRYVLFNSYADNLVPNDTNNTCFTAPLCMDVFLHDLVTGTTERVSVGKGGVEALGGDSEIGDGRVISADGRYVAFYSSADNLGPDEDESVWDVFVRDRKLGITERVSASADGTKGNDKSLGATISADGHLVAFWSDATNLVPGDTNGRSDIFVRTR